nr:MAG TPA: cytochrome c protein [Caudoviricetes sp.]
MNRRYTSLHFAMLCRDNPMRCLLCLISSWGA